MKRTNAGLMKDNRNLQAENAKLREALETIKKEPCGRCEDTEAGFYQCRIHWTAYQASKLSGEETNGK